MCNGVIMEYNYEIKNEKLKKMVENKAKELHVSTGHLIWMYINRGLLDDSFGEDVIKEVHSEEFLNEVNEALGLD